jgi:hypothetical protein
MYDILGILFLVSISAIFLLIPLAVGAMLVWIFDRLVPLFNSRRSTFSFHRKPTGVER